jgi:hypothetical protein
MGKSMGKIFPLILSIYINRFDDSFEIPQTIKCRQYLSLKQRFGEVLNMTHSSFRRDNIARNRLC